MSKYSKELIGTLLLVSILVMVLVWKQLEAPVQELTQNPKIMATVPSESITEQLPTWAELSQNIDRSGQIGYNTVQTESKNLTFRSLFIAAPSSLFDEFGRTNWSAGEISILNDVTGGTDVDSERAQFRGRGNTTWAGSENTAMRPLRFRTQEALNITGEGEAKDYILLAAGNEKSHFHNWTALTMASMLGGMSFVPSAEFINVYFNNQFLGVYVLTEERDREAHRSTILPHKIPAKSEFLIEQDTRVDGIEYLDYVVADSRYGIKEPSGTGEMTVAHGWVVRDLLLEFDTVLKEAAVNNDFALLSSYIDIDSFIDFYALNYALDVKDYGGLSVFFEIRFTEDGQLGSRSKMGAGRKIFMGPVWDFDVSAGTAPEDFSQIEVASDWLNYALSVTEFKEKFNARLAVFSQMLLEVQGEAVEVLDINRVNLEKSYELNHLVLQAENSINKTTLQADFDDYFNWLQVRFDWIKNNQAVAREVSEYTSVDFKGAPVQVEVLRGTDLIPITALTSVPFNGYLEWLEDRLVILEFEKFALRFESGSAEVKIQTGRFDSNILYLNSPVRVMSGRNVISKADLQQVLDWMASIGS